MKNHPVAEMFPLLDEGSQAFSDLAVSIKSVGQVEPIVVDGNVLLDGRNRLRACEILKIEPKFVEWSKLRLNMEQAEWISAKNIERRHLTDEQRVGIISDIDAWLAIKQNDDRKKASQFRKGNKVGTGGDRKSENSKSTVDTNSSPPLKRDIKQKNANSTAGRIAKRAGVSIHKAVQALRVKKAVEGGFLPQTTWDGIKKGTVKTSDAIKAIPAKKKSKPTKPIEKRVEIHWQKFLDKFPVAEHSEVKSYVRFLISK